MAQDYEVARKIWEAQVPVEFVLDLPEALRPPKPFYVRLC